MTSTKKSKTEAMALKIDIPNPELLKPKITIFGVGGAGGNAINNMIRSDLEGVEFIAANTDAQALTNSLAPNRIQLGINTTKGLGAGSFPERGRAAAEENIEEIEKFLEGSNMVFIAAGMGGGTGTGGAPVIAKLARERDVLTVGVVTKPFHFEGKYRMETAQKGIEELKKYVDTLIVIPNQNLFRIANEQTTFESAFKMADDVLHAGVRSITDLITMPGLVNLDFADIRTIMTKMGKAMMGTGEATGENRAVIACEAAISNPLLDDISIGGAKGVLVNMTGGPDMTLFEADLAVNTIKKEVDPNANIIFGSAFNENMKGSIRISVVATGIDAEDFKQDLFSPGTKKIAENQDPQRFKVEERQEENEANSENVKEESTKDYYDIGNVENIADEQIEEIDEVSFKTEENYSAEPNPEYGEELGNGESKEKTAVDGVEFSQISFFSNDEECDDGDSIKIQKKEEIELPKKLSKKLSKPTSKSKKEASGFNLFGFMNGGNSSKEEEVLDEAPKVENIEVEPQPKEFDKDKTEEASKKHREFFGSTVFDEESDEESEKIDDDILNVPAFFRRKK